MFTCLSVYMVYHCKSLSCFLIAAGVPGVWCTCKNIYLNLFVDTHVLLVSIVSCFERLPFRYVYIVMALYYSISLGILVYVNFRGYIAGIVGHRGVIIGR